MYQSKFLIPTVKEAPKDAQVFSHAHLIRAGYIKQNAAGIYTYLPLAKRVLRNIEQIVREEMDGIGAAEVTMPIMQASELWSESGRWQTYGDELFRLTDRHGRQFAMSPTAEEVAVDVVRNHLNSYKKFPLNIYQIQTKLRDERRPRFGLLRGREFTMFDGYSFHTDEESLELTYNEYYDAYKRVLDRLEIDYKVVTADNGSMGGSKSQEFMAISEIGEDTICYEDGIELAYNIETAPIYNEYQKQEPSLSEYSIVDTPNAKSIKDLCELLNIEESDTVKATCFDVDGKLIVAFCNGAREVEETKLLRYIGGETIELASLKLLAENDVVAGYVGPIGLNENVTVVFDRQVSMMSDFVVGANENEKHLTGVNFIRDINSDNIADICAVEEGDIIRPGGNPVSLAKGIEIGHIFALGDKYSKSMNFTFLDQNQKTQTPVMGCYGIGISRLLSAYVEQKNVDGSVRYIDAITPFDYHLIVLDYHKNEEQKEFAESIAARLRSMGKTVLIDDRNERVGSKMIDAELVGCSNQIVIGRDFKEGIIEFKNGKEKTKVNVEELYA